MAMIAPLKIGILALLAAATGGAGRFSLAGQSLKFVSGVFDLRLIRAMVVAPVIAIVRPLFSRASVPDDPDAFCCQADVDRSFNSPERRTPAALNSRM
jgi:hypothetical protein